jgi:mRNA interferase RelE/StbE
MAWTVSVAKPAQKQVARLPAKDQVRIGAAVCSLADDPFTGDVLKLEGQGNRWRRRVGNYRVFFAVDSTSKTVDVSAIVRRTSRTYK